MNPFGKNLNIKKRNPEYTEKEIFLDIVLTVDECWKRTRHMEEEMEMGMSSYEEPFYIMIENLLFIKYGEWKTDIVLWWVYNRYDEEGNVVAIKLNDHDNETEENVIVETTEQLWEFLKRVDNIEKNK